MAESIEAVARAKELNGERLRAWNEAKGILEDAASANRSLTAEETEKFQRINTEIDRLDAERDVFVQADRREREAAEIREAELRDLGEVRVTTRDFNERRMVADTIRSIANSPTGHGAPVLSLPMGQAFYERDLIRSGMSASEARALAWDTGSVASAVPVTTARSLYQYLEASIALFRAPTTKLVTGSGEQMKFPRLNAHAIGTQVIAQGTALAGTDPTFASMTLDAYKYGELVIVANEVLDDAVVDIGQFLARDMGRALGRVIDTDLVVGSGSSKPNGLITACTGSVATGGSLITPTYENLVDMVHSIADEYRNTGSAGWLFRDATIGTIRKLRDGAGGTVGAPLWEPSLTNGIQNGQPDRLLGFPVYGDPNVASLASNAKVGSFGDFSAYYVRTVGNIDVARDDSRYFDTDQAGFRAKWRVDGDLIDTAAVSVLKQNVS